MLLQKWLHECGSSMYLIWVMSGVYCAILTCGFSLTSRASSILLSNLSTMKFVADSKNKVGRFLTSLKFQDLFWHCQCWHRTCDGISLDGLGIETPKKKTIIGLFIHATIGTIKKKNHQTLGYLITLGFISGIALHLLIADWPKPWWSSCTGDCPHV
jgi:hypothetical protein